MAKLVSPLMFQDDILDYALPSVQKDEEGPDYI